MERETDWADQHFINGAVQSARSFTDDERRALRDLPLPPRVDYSDLVTLVYDQVGGGCGGCAILAVANILHEMECLYSPDLSMKFLGYVYNESGYLHRDQRIESGYEQSGVMVHYGCCSETSFPGIYLDYTDSPPLNKAFVEAKQYKIRLISPGSPNPGCEAVNNPDITIIKSWLYTYGPLLAHSSHHVFAIIGYDDDLQVIKLLNSWGDGWGEGGIRTAYYDKIQHPFENTDLFDIKLIQRIEIEPSTDFSCFTGRIRISHNISRKYLVVKCWAEGHDPLILWDSREADSCKNLNFDFPLPDYAAECWPPGGSHKWFIQISDNTPGDHSGTAASVREITLVERKRTSSGTFDHTIYKPSVQEYTVPYRGLVTIDVSAL